VIYFSFAELDDPAICGWRPISTRTHWSNLVEYGSRIKLRASQSPVVPVSCHHERHAPRYPLFWEVKTGRSMGLTYIAG